MKKINRRENKKNDLTPRMLSFLEYQSVICKDSTLKTYKISLKIFHQYLKKICSSDKIFKHHIKQLKPAYLKKYLIHLKQKKLAPYTKVNYLINLKKYLRWEIDQGNLNPALLPILDRKHLPKVPEYLPRPLTAANDRLLQHKLKNERSPYAPIFLLLRHTGLRISELIHLPWDPIVTNQKNESYLKVPLGKMNNERLVPLRKETIELINTIKDIYPIRLNQCDQKRLIGLQGNTQPVRNFLAKQFKKITDGLTDQNKSITFHRLRHSYATTLLSAGVPITSIMKLLGHRRIEMSLRYAKVTPSHLRDEYLKAVLVIQNQVGIKTNSHHSQKTYHPAELIDLIRTFIRQSAQLSTTKQKNILRKLSRIKNDLEQTKYAQKFTIQS